MEDYKVYNPNKTITDIHIWPRTFPYVPYQTETYVEDITFKGDLLYVEGKPYHVMILGDERNTPKRFVQDYDGSPRLICDFQGEETDWFLSDIILVPK